MQTSSPDTKQGSKSLITTALYYTCKFRYQNDKPIPGFNAKRNSDVNKDWTCKDKDKDSTHKDKDFT